MMVSNRNPYSTRGKNRLHLSMNGTTELGQVYKTSTSQLFHPLFERCALLALSVPSRIETCERLFERLTSKADVRVVPKLYIACILGIFRPILPTTWCWNFIASGRDDFACLCKNRCANLSREVRGAERSGVG